MTRDAQFLAPALQRGRGRVRPLAPAAAPRRVRRPGAAEGAARGRADRGDHTRGGARPRPAGRPAGPREDVARVHRPRGARRRHPHGRGAGDRAQGRPGCDPHLARDARRPVHRRDPPAEPGGRGDPLPGARGLPARHRHRPGAGGADADARPAALHARRRDDADRPADHAAARPLRHDLPARLLRAGRARARSCGARRGSSASTIADDAAEEIARRSRGTPRVANRILRRVRDVAEVRHAGAITAEIAAEALELLEVDEEGLERTDRELLEAIVAQVRRRAGRAVDAGGLARRGARHDRGRLRAVPAPAGVHPAHAPRPHRHRPRDRPRRRRPGGARGQPVLSA